MGVLLDSDENGKLNIIASDGVKLAANSVDYNGEIRAVIPKAAFKKLLSISSGNGITLKKTSSANQLAFETGEYTLFSSWKTISLTTSHYWSLQAPVAKMS